jgi:ribosomal protein S18 acetylase RimI-like enzyme
MAAKPVSPSALLSVPAAARDTVRLRPATPADAPAAAELIYLPMGRLADYVFGFDDPARARATLAQLFAREQNRFSHQFADVAEAQGRVAGLLLAYPMSLLNHLQAPMTRQLLALYGVGGLARIVLRAWPFLTVAEGGADEFLVFSLAVEAGFRGHGIGSQLLALAETKARAAGLTKCSLGVEAGNDGARRLYERVGYQMVETIRVRALERRIAYPGFHRMVKRLA